MLRNELSQFQDAPLAAVASRLIGPVGSTIILITAVVSMFGLLSGDILATPRILYAASKDKLLPAFLSRIHPTYATPYWSIIMYSSVGFIFASSGSFKQLAIFASSSVLIIYLAVILSMIRLRTKKGYHETGSFKVPGGLIIPLLAIITICWFLSHITVMEIIGLLVFFVLLTMFYFIYKLIRRQTNPIT